MDEWKEKFLSGEWMDHSTVKGNPDRLRLIDQHDAIYSIERKAWQIYVHYKKSDGAK